MELRPGARPPDYPPSDGNGSRGRVAVAQLVGTFSDLTLEKAVYGTGWDITVGRPPCGLGSGHLPTVLTGRRLESQGKRPALRGMTAAQLTCHESPSCVDRHPLPVLDT